MTASIVAKKLTKYYGRSKTPALDSLSFNIQGGEVYGYLGANGAGKSTTIRLLMNFLQPSSGSAKICGYDIVKDSVKLKKHVGYLAGDVALYQKATGKQLLDYLEELHSRPSAEYRYKLEKRFEAETSKPISALSKGNRQKIGIIQALMHEPDVLILDEPTSGLDPLMQEVFYDCIREAKARGAAVLMSSHNLVEAQEQCDRIGIIKHGKLIREQVMENNAQLTSPMFRITLAQADDVTRLKRSPGFTVISVHDNVAVIQLKEDISSGLKSLSSFHIYNIQSEHTDLEDEFLEFYGDKQ